MTQIECPDCGTTQDIVVKDDLYIVKCTYCKSQFKLPQRYRENKKENKQWTSAVNIRVGIQKENNYMHIGWTVQSAEKNNKYLEKDSVAVDVSDHPEKLYWYIALVNALNEVSEYKEARLWVKDKIIVKHISNDIDIPNTDLRSNMKNKILETINEKFYKCEVGINEHSGNDIAQMLQLQTV